MADDAQGYAIPGGVNLLLLLVASLACTGFLWLASHTASTWVLVCAAIAFSFTGNTIFSLLHEAVHGVFHARGWVNRLAGYWAAAFFPTAYSLQRSFHLTHHRNNRSRLERFDYLQDGDIKWLKYAQWYAILTGLYWLVSVLGVLTYLVVPGVLRTRQLKSGDSQVAQQTSSKAYLSALDKLPPVKTRLEILFTLAVQVSLFLVLDLSPVGWLACYFAFGFNWSSLQYADHAFSPLHVIDGAWNLRVNPIFRAFFLNYHYHLAHHQHPQLPWVYLGRFVDSGEPQPSYLRVWLSMWRGPRPLPAGVDQ